MIDLKEYWHLNGRKVVVICTDGYEIIGSWIDWTSAVDNEPDPESITVRRADGAPVEIFVHEIESIQQV